MDKKMKILSFVIFFVVVIALGFVVYSNSTKDDTQMLNEKVQTEVQYLEVKIVNMANRINNITTQNYKVVTKQIEEQSEVGDTSSKSAESGQQTQSQGNGGSNTSSGNSNTTGGNSSEGSGSSGSNSASSESEGSGASTGSSDSSNGYEEYNMDRVKQLSKDKEKEVNWDDVQKEIEEIYTVMPTITLDLYQTNINQEDILKFNGFLDDLAKAAKNEEEDKTLEQLCNMYYSISTFTDNVSNDDAYKTTIKTKSNVLKAYSMVNAENWDEVSKNMQYAIDVFSVLLTNTNIDYGRQVNINKIYVIINEMKNAAGKQDKDVFFIKYKNLLEEMSSM